MQVIEQDKPCHLYFDLEYEKSSNLELQGDVLVEKLVAMTVKLVRYTLKHYIVVLVCQFANEQFLACTALWSQSCAKFQKM